MTTEIAGAGGSYIEQADGSLKLISRTEPAKSKSELAADQGTLAEAIPPVEKPPSSPKPKKEIAE